MKSYKDKQLLFGLLFLGIAGGFAGHFFETEHLTFPSASNLNQAAAILATQENIVGIPAAPTASSFSIGFAESVPAATDVAFTEAADCGKNMSIKAYDGRTVGFLCLTGKEKDLDTRIQSAAAETNTLVVSLGATNAALTQQALADAAAAVIAPTKKDIWMYTNQTIVHGTSVTAMLTGNQISNLAQIVK